MVLGQSSPKGGIRGTPYVSSTLNLQMACLDLCRVCRSISSLHVDLWEGSPESLWVAPKDDDDEHDHDATVRLQTPEGERASDGKPPSRVPPILPFSVTCRLSSHVLHSKRTTKLWTRLERLRLELTLSAATGWNSSPVELPQRLKQLILIDRGEVRAGVIPAVLLSSPLSGGSLSLLKLRIDGNFDVPLQEVVWPASLTQIVLGNDFKRPVAGVVWPPFLQQLSFGLFDQDIAEVAWPASLQKLSFGRFNGRVSGGVLPPCLRQLSFEYFNEPIIGVEWPPSLQQLSFGSSFDQPVVGVVWPTSLQRLSFGDQFNQPIVGVEWPYSLARLNLGLSFNKPITLVVWPTCLKVLALPRFYRGRFIGTAALCDFLK